MKLKKVILVVLLALIVGIVIASKAYASASMELGIVSLREGGYGYSANTKNVWKIVEYQNGKYNYNNAIYCLRGGPGFGNSSYIENRVYNVSYNLKEYSTIPDSIKGILPSDGEQTYTSGGQTYTYTNYNAVLALLDNLYLPKDANAANFKQQLIKMAFPTLDPSDFVLTDDDIEVVQQCALWYFTNSDPSNVDQYAYHFETLPELQLTQTEGGQGPFNLTLDDLDSTWQRQDQASKLYNFLIDLAKKTASNYGNGDTRSVDTAPAEIADTNATSEINNGKIIVGPFRIEDNGNTSYDITAEVKDQNDNNLGYTILDENKQPIATGTTLKDLANKDFYVSVNNDVNISSVKVNISIGYSVTTPTFYTVGGSELIEQPVVVVDRTKQEESKEVEIPVKKEYDLSLRKFITSINGVSPTVSRTPVIDTTKLEDGTDTTAIYTQPKNALEVNTGDTVLYTIRIYNEGDFDGKATEVTDYLPAGLTLKAGSSINNTYGWTQNGQAITTTYLANQSAIPAFDKTKTTAGSATNWQKAGTGASGLYYADVQVECTVTATFAAQAQSLRNIAEITADDSNTYGVSDRDSTPKDVDINNYNPPSDNSKYQEDDDDYEQLILPGKVFDLSLRKFITAINGVSPTVSRTPVIDTTKLEDGTDTTAIYTQPKNALEVNTGDTVLYTIRIYNEGGLDGKATEVTDYLPAGLTLKAGSSINNTYGWTQNGQAITTTYLANQSAIPAFDKTKTTAGSATNWQKAGTGASGLYYADVQVECTVTATFMAQDQSLRNIAEITADNSSTYGVSDRDSTPKDVDINNYNPPSDNSKYQEDDDDYEQLILPGKVFDLSLRKFITAINGVSPTVSRTPVIDTTKLEDGTDTTAIYTQPKNALEVNTGDTVLYTIRIYNEGGLDGKATEVTDYLPAGLTLKAGSSINNTYGWTQNGQAITTTYLANQSAIPAFDKTKTTAGSATNWQKAGTGASGLYYADVQVECTVTAMFTAQDQSLRNIAEITADNSSTYGVSDRDSTPKDVDINNYNPPSDNSKYQEDDDDYEQLILPGKVFDLSLRKFITSINGVAPTIDRTPVVDATNLINGTSTTATYTHPKDPLFVVNNDIVIYTIRVFNEGNVAGFAEEVKDDVPMGLVFLPDNEINQQYRWQLGEDGSIRTDYLSKAQGEQNQIPAFDPNTMTTPAYRDVEVAFKVDQSAISNDPNQRIIINTAEISKDNNDYNIPDRDSTPDNGVPGEDDIDKEYVTVGQFDLALLKWVSKAYVTVDGKTTTVQGNSTSTKPNQDPVLKVDVNRNKINTTNITFVYTIQVINQGDIAGYAKEVKDTIPAGLKFVQSDNPNWQLDGDGNVVTDQLANTLLQPGDTASIQIAFRWIQSDSNFGLKTNIAQISKDYNDSNTPDRDSTPNNNVPEEDDQDYAQVIISIKTGDAPTYLGLITASIATLGGGVYFIRRFVL